MVELHLDRTALDRVIAAQSGKVTKDAATRIAKAVRRQNLKVESTGGGPNEDELPVRVYGDEDGTAAVILAHPAGVLMQARHGALTRAAAAEGFEVQS